MKSNIEKEDSKDVEGLLDSLKVLSNLQEYAESDKEFEAHKRPIPYEKEVEDIQNGLQFLGFSLPVWGVDGKFGPETRKAVENFQNSVGLEETGKVDRPELEKLVSELKSKNFETFDISKLTKQKSQSLKTIEPGQKIVIDDSSTSTRKYPSDLMERFKKVAGDDYDEFISGCESIGLDPNIAVRQLYSESAFSPEVMDCSRKSSAGAMGIAQFMPGTWKAYGYGSPCNVSDSLKAYIKLMGDHLKRFPGRPDLAVSGYNSGPNLKAYKRALDNETPFEELKGKIPNESYKYTTTIFQS
jgi:hypothetical protein